MNRYVVAGLLADMRAGKRVVVVTPPGQAHVLATLDTLTGQLPPGVRSRRAHGETGLEQTQGSGRIWIMPQGASLRGWDVNTVYADTDLTDEQLSNAQLAAPEVIRR